MIIAALVVGAIIAIIAIVSGGAGFRHQPPFEDAGGGSHHDRATRPSERVAPRKPAPR